MLEGLFSNLTNPVPPVPPAKNQREPLQPAPKLAVPLVPPVPPKKTKVKQEIVAKSEPRYFGFTLTRSDGSQFQTTTVPHSTLSEVLELFPEAVRAEAVDELGNTLAALEQPAKSVLTESVTCYTPNGSPVTVQAEHAEQSEWLQRMNLKPARTVLMPGSDTRNVNLTGQGAEAVIIRWLHWIGENNADLINEVLDKCRTDKAALNYYLKRSGEVGNPPPPGFGISPLDLTHIGEKTL